MRDNRHHSAGAVLIVGQLLEEGKPHARVVQVARRGIEDQQIRGAALCQGGHELDVHLAVQLVHPQAVQILEAALLQPAARVGTTKNRQIVGEHLRDVVVHAHVLLWGGHIGGIDNVADAAQLLH